MRFFPPSNHALPDSTFKSPGIFQPIVGSLFPHAPPVAWRPPIYLNTPRAYVPWTGASHVFAMHEHLWYALVTPGFFRVCIPDCQSPLYGNCTSKEKCEQPIWYMRIAQSGVGINQININNRSSARAFNY